MRSAALLMLLSASPALAAELSCTFATECLETDACAETTFTLTVEDVDRERAITLVTDAETLRGTQIDTDGPDHMIFLGDSAVHLLSVVPGSGARYTVHMEGPMAVTYHGICERTE